MDFKISQRSDDALSIFPFRKFGNTGNGAKRKTLPNFAGGSNLSWRRVRGGLWRTGLIRASDVRCLEALRPLHAFELNRFAFIERPVAGFLDGGEVHEHVFASGTLNEAVPFGTVKPLNCTPLSHRRTPFASKMNLSVRRRVPAVPGLAGPLRAVAYFRQHGRKTRMPRKRDPAFQLLTGCRPTPYAARSNDSDCGKLKKTACTKTSAHVADVFGAVRVKITANGRIIGRNSDAAQEKSKRLRLSQSMPSGIGTGQSPQERPSFPPKQAQFAASR